MAFIDLRSQSPLRQFHERHPDVLLWAIAAVNAVAMLGINFVLRWIVA